MKDAVVVYPHQLYAQSPAIARGRPVFLLEEPMLLIRNPAHRSRLVLHKLSMDAYQAHLEQSGHDVVRVTIADHPTTNDMFDRLRAEGVGRMHIVDAHDHDLEQAIGKCGLERVWYDTPLFVLKRKEATERYIRSNRYMASFYKQLRIDKSVLIDSRGGPIGGKWNFDGENRRKIPRNVDLPQDIEFHDSPAVDAAAVWAEGLQVERYGAARCWLPHTHAGAEDYLQEFLRDRFGNFGPYEDAMTTGGVRLWHSALSPLLNIGLLTPQQVLDAALDYAWREDVQLNSVEGFVRQVLGWREFIRASYEVDGVKMRNGNFWKHSRSLPASFWTGETGVLPVDHVITTARSHGYTHHIERLMVIGNFMLLSQIHPDEVYRWFMGMFIDAYDWVMVPNVYGMSQFADGGSFATKPYISGANYIRKMSDFERGDWVNIWTALYWNFIDDHKEVFKGNHRLSMMPRLLGRMSEEMRQKHIATARDFLSQMAL